MFCILPPHYSTPTPKSPLRSSGHASLLPQRKESLPTYCFYPHRTNYCSPHHHHITQHTARNPLISPLSPRRCARSQYSPLPASAIIKLFSSLISADLLFDYTIFPARPIQASTFLAANRSLQAKARAEKPIMRFQSSKVLIPIFFGQLLCRHLGNKAFEF